MKHTIFTFEKDGLEFIYELRLTIQDIIDIERLIGSNPINFNTDGRTISTHKLGYLLFFSMRHTNRSITIDDSFDIIDELGQKVILDIMIRLFTDMGIIDDEEIPHDDTSPSSDYINDKPQTLEAHYKSLYNDLIKQGVDISNFWDMNNMEVKDLMVIAKGKNKNTAYYDFTQAATIAAFTGSLMSKKAKPPKLEKMYPGLFKEEIEKKESVDVKTIKAKANLDAWVANFERNIKLRQLQEKYNNNGDKED